MTVRISSEILEQLQAQARAGHPLEICGLLLGEKSLVSGFQQTKNVSQFPDRHFEIDPSALIAAERAMRDGGSTILGYYHSHPTGDVSPSQTDAESAAPDGRYWLIIDGREAALWQAVDKGEVFGRFNPIALD